MDEGGGGGTRGRRGNKRGRKRWDVVRVEAG